MKIVSESPDRAIGVCPKRQTRRGLAGVLAVAMLATAWAGVSRARAEDLPAPTPPEKTTATFRLPPGFQIGLVASEPHLANPISMALHGDRAIFVSLAHSYRYGAEGSPVKTPSNPIVRLALDANGDVTGSQVVLSGFENPVMGLTVHRDRLWLTNLNRVLVAELDDDGVPHETREILRDAETPWNPFGMYRIRSGRDGLLYLSIGDHATKLSGPEGLVEIRGNTGTLFRFRDDGTALEVLVQGMRAPFSFETDSFGNLRILSNGEGNPNRLIHAVRGADYHFQTRAASWPWLAGKEPLAPPVRETPNGAHTDLLRYESSAFPAEYRGDLFVSNWGVHGFPSANHVVVRYRVDERGELKAADPEPFLTTTDARFRPTRLDLDPDGNLYVLDWYGRDDENDLTGRLFKISYGISKGDDSNDDEHRGESVQWDALDCEQAAARLGDPNHAIRAKAAKILRGRGAKALPALRTTLREDEALAAAEALWILRRSDLPETAATMETGLHHRDWKVRQLALFLLRDVGKAPPTKVRALVDDPDLAVAVEAARSLPSPNERVTALGTVLRAGAAASQRLRYSAALEIGRDGRDEDFQGLLDSKDPNVRLAGRIALDSAFHEAKHGGRSADAAGRVLAHAISRSSTDATVDPLLELLAIAERWPHPALRDAVVTALGRSTDAEVFARVLAILRKLEPPVTSGEIGDAPGRFLDDVAAGRITLSGREQKLAVLDVLALEPATSRRLEILGELASDPTVRTRAFDVLAGIGVGKSDAIELCWRVVEDEGAAPEARMEAVVAVSRIEERLRAHQWTTLLRSPTERLARVALRCLRAYAGQPDALAVLEAAPPRSDGKADDSFLADYLFTKAVLVSAAPPTQGDSASTSADADEEVASESNNDTAGEEAARQALRARLLKNLPTGDPFMGSLAFRSRDCDTCHAPASGALTPFGPALNGVAKTNPPEYLIDSILYPSKVVKTGFLMEIVLTQDGQTYSGKIFEEGDRLLVRSSPQEAVEVPVADVLSRQQEQLSIMPALLEKTMSEPELVDLLAYLTTL